ncbi:MAG: phosphate acyltransferase PlsX [Alphaproteobacteria bacterium]|nr:phosphate acyltransferase PlsX [Alphaproteobacteria bacterium]
MSNTLVISIDAMGGDNAPEAVIEGVARVAKKDDSVFFFLFGDEDKIKKLADINRLPDNRYKIHHTTDVIKGDAKPSIAIRSGRESSMWKAIMSVRNGYSKAVVSAGNTGALMAMSKICLGTLSGIDRPAIAGVMPALTGPIVALDLGANAECNSQNLVEFSIMGHVLYRVLFQAEKPTVGLLNIGSEETKGRDEIREAATVLKGLTDKVNFIGFVEGNDICAGKSNVVVSDGFSGNIALKTIEGTAKFITSTLKETVRKSFVGSLGFLIARPALNKLKKKIDPRMYNGAMFLGLNGISVKSHGGADAFAFSCAVEAAIRMARNDLCNKIKTELKHVMDVDVPDISGEA